MRNTKVKYFQKGDDPLWLIYSGTHGDEADVVFSIEKYIQKNEHRLPDFLWVPHVSPSAVERKVRHNARGLDINRNFLDHSTEEEILANLEIVRGKNFQYFLDFHEDLERTEFYLYDSLGVRDELMDSILLAQKENGIELWHGMDDKTDSKLGSFVENGYCDASKTTETSGFSVDYMLLQGIVKKRAWTFETPSLVAQEEKDKIVERIFHQVQNFLA